jgi:histone H3/H4
MSDQEAQQEMEEEEVDQVVEELVKQTKKKPVSKRRVASKKKKHEKIRNESPTVDDQPKTPEEMETVIEPIVENIPEPTKKVVEKPKRTTVSKAERSGLVFSVGRVNRHLREKRYSKRVGGDAPVFLAATLEYLVAELMELSGDSAKHRANKGNKADDLIKGGRINEKDFFHVLKTDAAFAELCNKIEFIGKGIAKHDTGATELIDFEKKIRRKMKDSKLVKKSHKKSATKATKA